MKKKKKDTLGLLKNRRNNKATEPSEYFINTSNKKGRMVIGSFTDADLGLIDLVYVLFL